MHDIASSLEKEFADISQAEREATITELRRIESAGRGTIEVKPHAILLPLLFGGCGGILIYCAITTEAVSPPLAFAIGLLLLLPSLWAMFGPRGTRFTLTEQGIAVKDAVLPWTSIDDYNVVENSYNGFSTHTSVVLLHTEGFTPPKLPLAYLFGTSTRHRKTGLYETRLTLHAGARGMNVEKLATRIGDFFAAAHARTELNRLQAN